MSLVLILGGTRSGKSRRAEQLAEATGLPVRYIATADGSDPDMAARIRTHAERRPGSWQTIEVATGLALALQQADGRCVLLDGLGTWIATLMHATGAFEHADDDQLRGRVRHDVMADVDRLASFGPATTVIVVAEDAGHGVLPADRGSRAWLDLLGDAVARLSESADQAELVVAGRVLDLGGHDRRAR